MSASPDEEVPATSGWERLCGTGLVVQARDHHAAAAPSRRWWPRLLLAGAATLAATVLIGHLEAVRTIANGTADSDLFSLTNGDRSSNGLGSLRGNGSLASIGEAGAYRGCSGAGTIQGRSQDMINRNYFSHPIPPCGQLVFSIMQAYGIAYRSAGENIGWESGIGDPAGAAQYLNNSFMNSPDHRSNILNRSYTDMGIGSAVSPPGVPWHGAGGSILNVWMFSEEFAQLGSPPPPPPPPPRPPRRPTPSPVPRRNSPAPSAPAITPVAIAAPTPVATATASPTATAAPGPFLLPYLYLGQGVISDTVEAVLEGFLLG